MRSHVSAQEKISTFCLASSVQRTLGCWRVSHVSLLITSMCSSADSKRPKNLWKSCYVSTREQASLISAPSHQAARRTSMSPTRCSLTPRTRLKQHGRQKHEQAYKKMTCSFISDLSHNGRVLGQNLFPLGVEEAASEIRAHLREEPPHPFSQPLHARSFARLTTWSQPIAFTTSFHNRRGRPQQLPHSLSALPHVRFPSHCWSCLIPNQRSLWVGTASGMSSGSTVSCCDASIIHVLFATTALQLSSLRSTREYRTRLMA